MNAANGKWVFMQDPRNSSPTWQKSPSLPFHKTAQEWWQPYTLNPPDPPPTFTSNYLDFHDELHTQFGKINPSGKAAHKLDKLTKKDHPQATKYSIQLITIAAQTQFEEAALQH